MMRVSGAPLRARYFQTFWLSGTWTNQPGPGQSEVFGTTFNRIQADLTLFERVAMAVNVSAAGAGGAQLVPQVSLDDVAYVDLNLNLSTFINVAGRQPISFEIIPVAYRGRVFLRLTGVGGNGVADPAFRVDLLFQG